VSYIAVPDAELDYLSEDEVELIASGLPYLEEVWSSDDWALYRVDGATGLSSGPIAVEQLNTTSFSVSADRPAEGLVRIKWTPYWEPSGASACVSRSGNWTRVELREPGEVEIGASPDLDGFLRGDRSCSE
jgi:hypothetical protein